MNPAEEPRGTALWCDVEGRILEVARDDLGLAAGARAGARLEDLLGDTDRAKTRNFLETVRHREAAFGWEIGVVLQGRAVTLHFAGLRLEARLFLVAARTRNGIAGVQEELMRINNDLANALRATAKDLSHLRQNGPGGAAPEEPYYEALTGLNNELANLQRELARKNAELERVNQDKNRLLGMAAHDLRSPLGIILTYSEFLEEEAGPALTAEQREFIGTIRSTSEFLLRLLGELLDVAQIESGQLRLQRQAVDFVALLRHVVGLQARLAQKKRIALEFEALAGFPTLVVDPGKLEQVMNNLLTNAVKYSFPDTRVRVTLEADGDGARVSVRDQGPGIPAAEMHKLFQPFSKTTVKTTAGEPSNGLGLWICRRILEGHGGRIWAESAVGQGSTFHFWLPLRVDVQRLVDEER